MNINCKDIRDFCELINVSIGQGLQNQCVFVSSKTGYPGVAVPTSPKDYKSFTYTFLTPLYTVIYSGNIKANTFEEEYEILKDTCSKFDLRIHTFDKLKYNANTDTLSLEAHIDVI